MSQIQSSMAASAGEELRLEQRPGSVQQLVPVLPRLLILRARGDVVRPALHHPAGLLASHTCLSRQDSKVFELTD